MPNIIIDEGFKSLLPALSEETKASLEANLISRYRKNISKNNK